MWAQRNAVLSGVSLPEEPAARQMRTQGHRATGTEEAAATTSWGWDGKIAPPRGRHCTRIISVNFQDLLSFVFL